MQDGGIRWLAALQATTVHSEHVQACPEIGPICEVRDEPPQIHDQRFWIGQLRLVGGYALTPAWGLEVHGQVKLIRSGITYRDLDGREFVPSYADVHHRAETLVGVTDPWLLGRFTGRLGDVALTLRGGVTAPLGRIEENPFELGEAGAEHQHLQFGTGTWDPVVGAQASWTVGRVGLFGYGLGILTLYENRFGYRSGDRLAGGVGATWRGGERWSLRLGADLLYETAERWDGRVLDEGNLGRTDLLVGGGTGLRVAGGLLGIGVKIPVVSQVHAGQGSLSYPALLEVTFQPD